MIMPIHLYGAAVWNGPVREIDGAGDKLVRLVRDMFETMHESDGVGLSATQVGLRFALAVIDLSDVKGRETEKPLVVINPEILESGGESVMDEGCLSIPGIRAEVARAETVVVRFRDGSFRWVEAEFTGMPARVFQHEYDHLHQKFFVDRLSGVKRQLIKPKLSKIRRGEAVARYPVLSAADEKRTKRARAVEYDFYGRGK